MMIALSSAPADEEGVAAAVALARSSGSPDAFVVVPGPAQPAGGQPTPLPHVTVRLGECYDRAGAFQPIKLGRRLDALGALEGAVLVLDSSVGPAAIVDSLGNRTGEIPYHAMRRFFWRGPRPEVIVHFVPPHLLQYYARDWVRFVRYPPAESTRSNTHDDANNRIAAMIHQIDGLRSHFNPWDRFKRRVRDRLRSWTSWRP